MVADSDLPYFRGCSRQRGRGFGSLAQTIERTAIPFLRRYVVPAAKRVNADLLEIAAPEIGIYPLLYQSITEGKFFYLDEATPFRKPSNYYTLDPGLYPSISDTVNEMNRKIQEREKYEKTPIKLHVNKITQRIFLRFPNQTSLLVIFSADLCRVFGGEEAVYGLGVFMSGAGPHFPKFPYDLVRTHTLILCNDIFEYNIVGDTKAALSRCIPFISKVKNGDVISTGQYKNYQNFLNLQYKKNSKKLIPQHKTRAPGFLW